MDAARILTVNRDHAVSYYPESGSLRVDMLRIYPVCLCKRRDAIKNGADAGLYFAELKSIGLLQKSIGVLLKCIQPPLIEFGSGVLSEVIRGS